MNCAELESLLCDCVDGVLHGSRKTEFEGHLAVCAACTELFEDVTGAVDFMERAAVVEPPAELLTRILHVRPPSVRQTWWRRSVAGQVFGTRFESLFDAVLQPRYMMGMAMTVLSFSMIARFAGIQPRQLSPADLDPAKIYMAADGRMHRTWDRTMKYYENLRWVLELQSRMKEWTDQEQELQKNAPAAAAAPAPGAEEKK